MAPSKLLLHPKKSADGIEHQVTPQSAGWTYVGFESRRLTQGARLALKSEATEICLVALIGKLRVTAKGFDSQVIGERASVFDGLPWSVYLPPRTSYLIEAISDCEIALCASPATGKLPARVIPPTEVETLTRGQGSNTRFIRNILSETAVAESLLVVEVITPGGNWSSYPPHKHDRDALPKESYLEETYYHRFAKPSGYGVQRVYTDDRALDETMTIRDRDVVLVPRGYHPVGAAHGYDLYYLNVMAGPKRTWRFHNDPDHEWLMG